MPAHAALFAHTYAHPVETHLPGAQRYGPHDPSTAPTTVTVLPRRPLGKGDTKEVPLAPSAVRQRELLNTLAYVNATHRPVKDSDMATPTRHAGTEADPIPLLLGHCQLDQPAERHDCRGWYMHRGRYYSCSCSQDGCPCAARNKALQEGTLHKLAQQQVAAAIAAAPAAPAVTVTGWVQGQDDLPTRCTGADDCPAPLHVHGCYADMSGLSCDDPAEHHRAAVVPATAWTADEVADLMVELEQCPLCSSDWPVHVFTDDDRVVCPA